MTSYSEISRFPFEEALKLEVLLESQGCPVRKRKVDASDSDALEGTYTFVLSVETAQFERAIEVLKRYFNLVPAQAFSGSCASCGHVVEELMRCPNCGLNLSGNALGGLRDHPFVEYLLKTGRL